MSMSSAKFIENTHIIHAFPSVAPSMVIRCDDMFLGNPQSDVISLHGAQRVVFFIINNKALFHHKGDATVGGTATITVEGCKRPAVKINQTCPLYFLVRKIKNPDTNSIVLAADATNTFTTWGRTDTIYEIEVDACQLPSCSADAAGPWEYVRMKVVEATDRPVSGAYMALLHGLRDAEDALPTQVT